MTTHFVVIDLTVHLLELYTDGEGKLFEVEFPAVVLAEDIVFNLFLDVSLGTVIVDCIIEEIEDKMNYSILYLLAQVLLQLLHLPQHSLWILLAGDVGNQLELQSYRFLLLPRNALQII